MKHAHSAAVQRAALPEVLFIPDVGLALQVGDSAARRAVLRGECGPYLRIGRRLAVLRETFLAALARRQAPPSQRLHLLSGEVVR